MKIKAKLRQLTDADVRYISLVERGANRIPFRIVKSDSKENSMGIDLSKLGLRVTKSAAPVSATVSAVVLAKNAPALVEKAVESLKAEGFDLPVVTSFDDGSVTIAKDDKYMDGGTVVRLSDGVAVVMKNFDDFGQTLSTSDIGKDADTQGFYEGVSGALNHLRDRVTTVLKSDGDRSKEMREAVADFYTYVDGLVAAIPAAVFKAENPLTDLVGGFKEEAPKVEEQPVVKEEPKVEEPKKDEAVAPVVEPVVEPVVAPVVEATVAKSEEPAKPNEELAAVLQAVQGLTATVGGLAENVQKLSGELESVKKSTDEKLADVTRKAETAERVLKGTVVGSSTPGDPSQESTVVTKSDDDPRSGQFDTAFLRFSR
jgi:hypothetical protein